VTKAKDMDKDCTHKAKAILIGPVLLIGPTMSDRLKYCSFIRSDRGSMVRVLLLRSDRAKWFGPKRPTRTTNGSNRSTDCTVLLANQRSGWLVRSGLTD